MFETSSFYIKKCKVLSSQWVSGIRNGSKYDMNKASGRRKSCDDYYFVWDGWQCPIEPGTLASGHEPETGRIVIRFNIHRLKNYAGDYIYHQNDKMVNMNKVTKSVKTLGPIFDLLMGRNSATAIEKVMAKYPFTRHWH